MDSKTDSATSNEHRTSDSNSFEVWEDGKHVKTMTFTYPRQPKLIRHGAVYVISTEKGKGTRIYKKS